MEKVGNKIDVVQQTWESEVLEEGCEIVEVLSETEVIVKLSSDDTLKCLVKYSNGVWDIIEDINF